MVFSSIPFLFFFLPIFLMVYYILPFKNISLMIFSLIFYAWGEPIYILLMLFSSIVDFTIGKLIEKKENKKIYLIMSIVINLMLLGFFKYSDFIIININNLFNLNINTLNLGLPIGISFFTFQTMSYSIDVYRGNVKACKKFFNFLTYVSMFPQLIAGPIVRYEEVDKELEKREITFNNFNSGLIRFLNGLFKKVLIANYLGKLFEILTVNVNDSSMIGVWVGIISFSMQIYFDFSGYSDMAIGIGKMLGFTYPENFNYPFISKSITEFWRRWHISLSSWFKDYLYIPLGGNRHNQVRNILIVWLCTGLWHGASWNFILWGLYFGILLLLEKYVFKNILEKIPNIFRHIVTIFLVVISFYIFAFDDMNKLIGFGKVMFGLSDNPVINIETIFNIKEYIFILILGLIFSTPILKERVKINWITISIYVILFILVVALLVSNTYNPFLYFRF